LALGKPTKTRAMWKGKWFGGVQMRGSPFRRGEIASGARRRRKKAQNYESGTTIKYGRLHKKSGTIANERFFHGGGEKKLKKRTYLEGPRSKQPYRWGERGGGRGGKRGVGFPTRTTTPRVSQGKGGTNQTPKHGKRNNPQTRQYPTLRGKTPPLGARGRRSVLEKWQRKTGKKGPTQIK